MQQVRVQGGLGEVREVDGRIRLLVGSKVADTSGSDDFNNKLFVFEKHWTQL